MDRIFSGIQPTGDVHLGNYLGAIRNWTKMQDDGIETVYCLVDLHAITQWQSPEQLRANVLDMATALLACGISPEKSVLLVQSANPHHSELNWIFSTVGRIGWLNRMTQFKEKAGKHKENASVGLYVYPILMAADILLYHANLVPVGDDQLQHLELARDIAQKFNHDYQKEDFFPLPEATLQAVATRVMSLRDGTSKMSKSDPSDMTRILLKDDADMIAQKIKKAKTDPLALPETVDELEGRAEAKNLLSIYAALNNQTLQNVLSEYAGKNFSDFKPILADNLIAHLAPISEKMKILGNDKTEVERILQQGAEKAMNISTPIITEIREIVGLQKIF